MSADRHALEISYVEPLRAFQPFAADPVSALLDSADPSKGRGRYAYIAADPFDVVGADGADPFAALERALGCIVAGPPIPGLPPFQGGAVGFIGYEAAGRLERLPSPKASGLDFPEALFGIYDTIAAFDIRKRKAWIVAVDSVPGRESPDARTRKMAAIISAAPPLPALDWSARGDWRAETTRPAFEAMIARVVEYIRAGDIFQANMSQRFIAAMPPGLVPCMLYRRLRHLSPAPFAAYLNCGSAGTILSASPELFLDLDADGRIETRPIKGTRRRGGTPAEDEALAKELLASEKDRAENLMIVDLLRNDLSRVSRIGSVRTPALFALETYANVHHLVSVVEGRLLPGLGPVDLLRATFPGGSITGAPKIRAMEIIAELEPSRRGPYCGTIAAIGFDGRMTSNIVIRTLVLGGSTVVAQAGGGIVADSDPAAEYDETIVKAGALLRSLDAEGVENP